MSDTRVLIVDDSAMVRRTLSTHLAAQDGIEVVGTAVDPFVARRKILQLDPDVVTLDIEMPRMDGLTFLGKMMAHHPIPTIILSSLAPRNSDNAARALMLGAVGVVAKPTSRHSVDAVIAELVQAVRRAAVARVKRTVVAESTAPLSLGRIGTTHKLIALGASTGGPQAIEHVLRSMPAGSPGIVVAQHMPAGFTQSFASRLNDSTELRVKEAAGGEAVVPGTVWIAPGDYHLEVVSDGAAYKTRLTEGPREHHQRPAVDVLFRSVASAAGGNAIGALLTGMGKDGAEGLLQMKKAGAHTIAEAEGTAVVFGMPRAAIELGATSEVKPLPRVAAALLGAAEEKAA